MNIYYLHLLQVVDSTVQTFLTYCHPVVDSNWHAIPFTSLQHDASKGNRTFVCSLDI